MFVVSKDKKCILNADNINDIHLGRDGYNIKVEYTSGKGCQIGRYENEKQAIAALEILIKRMENNLICLVPDDNEVKAYISLEQTKWHHATGKKTKGHGGS